MYSITLEYINKLKSHELIHQNGQKTNLVNLDISEQLLQDFEVELIKHYEERKIKEIKHY